MHLSMHNWMRAEPIETTIARLAKRSLRFSCSLSESKLVAHVIRTERGVVDNRAKRDFTLEARQQHRPGEVTRADHVESFHPPGQAPG